MTTLHVATTPHNFSPLYPNLRFRHSSPLLATNNHLHIATTRHDAMTTCTLPALVATKTRTLTPVLFTQRTVTCSRPPLSTPRHAYLHAANTRHHSPRHATHPARCHH